MTSRGAAQHHVPGRGADNTLSVQDRAAHDWFRFELSFPPHLVRHYLQRFCVGPQHLVLDPFCGTATSLVECRKLGIGGVGIEAHPLLHFVSRVKVDWTPDPRGCAPTLRSSPNGRCMS
jgi:hypothetical protein